MADETTVDDLRYDIPENILEYEAKFAMGLTINDMMGAAIPFMLLMGVMPPGIAGIIVAAVGGLCGLLAVKKFERFGNRGLLTYLGLRIIHAIKKPMVEIPVLVPMTGLEVVTIETWDGDRLMELGG